MAGIGSDDATLIRVFHYLMNNIFYIYYLFSFIIFIIYFFQQVIVTRSEIDLGDIKDAYENMYGKSLAGDIDVSINSTKSISLII